VGVGGVSLSTEGVNVSSLPVKESCFKESKIGSFLVSGFLSCQGISLLHTPTVMPSAIL
jgi:hypothetical protein